MIIDAGARPGVFELSREYKPMQCYFNIDGMQLEYQWHGPEPDQAPTLVLLHEGLGCVELWRDFPARMADASGCGVLVYSRAGYGRSDPVAVPRPLTYMHHEGLEVLPKVIDAAELRRVVLVGHSDGGSIALIHGGGVRDPRVLGIVTLAAHVFNEELCVTSIRAARDAFDNGDLRTRLTRYHGSNVDCAFWGWNRAWLDPGFMQWNIGEYLPGIRVPLLAIQGKNDEYGTLQQLEAIRDQTGALVETLLLADCGHSPQRDQPEATVEAIRRFVAGLC
jgi:pimeloyl-ACP methyl ester carboxylesterase